MSNLLNYQLKLYFTFSKIRQRKSFDINERS